MNLGEGEAGDLFFQYFCEFDFFKFLFIFIFKITFTQYFGLSQIFFFYLNFSQ